MNKAQLVAKIAYDADIKSSEAQDCVASIISAITGELKAGGSVSLVGFGTFTVDSRAARHGRNPKTGEPMEIKARNRPGFKAGKGLKDALNS